MADTGCGALETSRLTGQSSRRRNTVKVKVLGKKIHFSKKGLRSQKDDRPAPSALPDLQTQGLRRARKDGMTVASTSS